MAVRWLDNWVVAGCITGSGVLLQLLLVISTDQQNKIWWLFVEKTMAVFVLRLVVNHCYGLHSLDSVRLIISPGRLLISGRIKRSQMIADFYFLCLYPIPFCLNWSGVRHLQYRILHEPTVYSSISDWFLVGLMMLYSQVCKICCFRRKKILWQTMKNFWRDWRPNLASNLK